MKTLVGAECLKLRTTRSAPIALAIAAALSAGMPFAYAAAAGSGDIDEVSAASLVDIVRGPSYMGGGAVLLIGLLAAAGEFRHRTIFTSRLQEPRSTRLLVAKLIAMAIVGFVAGVVMAGLSLAGGAIVLTQHDVNVDLGTPGLARLLAVLPVAFAVQGIVGAAIGALARNTAAAVGGTLVWALIIEGVLPVVLRRPGLGEWLPSGALKQVTVSSAGSPLTPLEATALVLTYAAAIVGVTIALDRAREL